MAERRNDWARVVGNQTVVHSNATQAEVTEQIKKSLLPFKEKGVHLIPSRGQHVKTFEVKVTVHLVRTPEKDYLMKKETKDEDKV